MVLLRASLGCRDISLYAAREYTLYYILVHHICNCSLPFTICKPQYMCTSNTYYYTRDERSLCAPPLATAAHWSASWLRSFEGSAAAAAGCSQYSANRIQLYKIVQSANIARSVFFGSSRFARARIFFPSLRRHIIIIINLVKLGFGFFAATYVKRFY